MPTFTFLVVDPDVAACHVDLPNIQAARAEALRLAGELIRDAAGKVRANDHWQIEVLDENGIHLVLIEVSIATPIP